ncbi:MAG: hypothetical protein HON53_12775, partial [Planctomycetaceae bacterium]|nr:hypothetical protein [Planctomycetaceae bacterium]
LSTLVTISGWKGAVSGLGKVNGKIAPELPVSSGAVVKPGKIENGKRYRLQIACIQNRGRVWIKATLNQRPFINWKGPPEALASSPGWGVPCPETIGIFVTGSSLADIHKLQLTVARGGEAYRLGDDFQNPISAPSPSPPKEIVDKCINRNGRYYVFSQKPINIIEAQMLAAKLKGRLLTISSAEEEAFILKEGRGISLWMSGWRQSATRDWRDERNRPLRFIGRWARSQPMLRGFWETRLAIHTAAGTGQGWHDYPIARKNHACIEWGEEYPAAE